jgi:hypothetical protein
MGRVRVAGVKSNVSDEPGRLRRIAVESVAVHDPDLLPVGGITHPPLIAGCQGLETPKHPAIP